MEIIPASPSFGVDFPLDGSVPYLGSLESHPQVYSGTFPPLMSPSQEIYAGSETQHTIAVPDFPVWHATQDERGSYISRYATSSASRADRSHLFAHIQRILISPIFSRTLSKTPPIVLPTSLEEHQLLRLKPREIMQQIIIKHCMLPETFIGR
jgi:hypothetical protein